MNDEVDLARGWLLKAASDISAAKLVTDGDGPYDTACFHSQQAIEKALKAFLALKAQPIPHTHDLNKLRASCASLAPLPELADLNLTVVSDYGVLVRYDLDFWPERKTATDALLLAEKVFEMVSGTLPAGRRLELQRE